MDDANVPAVQPLENDGRHVFKISPVTKHLIGLKSQLSPGVVLPDHLPYGIVGVGIHVTAHAGKAVGVGLVAVGKVMNLRL
jgi:hypothetical protein